MKSFLSIFLNIVDWLFFAIFILSIYFLILTNYSGFNIIPFIEFGSMVIIFFLLFYYFKKIIWAVEKRAQTGPESLIGKTGTVTKELNPVGEVRVDGIIWKARSVNNDKIDSGKTIVVKNVENISLIVEKVNK